MIVGSFLVKNLLQPWQHGSRWFWDTLVDADLANNTLNWQWVAGSGADAAPYFRIFNPVTQGERYDPDGEYVRRWVPDIAHFPNHSIHGPWQKSRRNPKPAAEPLVDLGSVARGRARRLRRHAPARKILRRMELRYSTLDVFTDRPFGGNPLAVFLRSARRSRTSACRPSLESSTSQKRYSSFLRETRELCEGFASSRQRTSCRSQATSTIGAVHTLVEAGIAKHRRRGEEFALELEVGLVPIRVQAAQRRAAVPSAHDSTTP